MGNGAPGREGGEDGMQSELKLGIGSRRVFLFVLFVSPSLDSWWPRSRR